MCHDNIKIVEQSQEVGSWLRGGFPDEPRKAGWVFVHGLATTKQKAVDNANTLWNNGL